MTIYRRRKSPPTGISPEARPGPRPPNLAPRPAEGAPGGPSNQRPPEESFRNHAEQHPESEPIPGWEGNFGYDKISYRYPIELPKGWRLWKYDRRTGERLLPDRIFNRDGGGRVHLGVRRARAVDECEAWLRVECNPAKFLNGNEARLANTFDIREAVLGIEGQLDARLRIKPGDFRQITKLEVARDFERVQHTHEHLERFARYRRKGSRAPNRSWGVDRRLETVCIGPSRHAGIVFYDKSKERGVEDGASTVRFEVKLHGNLLDEHLDCDNLEDLEPVTPQRVLEQVWFEAGFDSALVHLVPYLHIVDALLAGEKTYDRDAYLFSKVRQALGTPGIYTDHYRKRFAEYDRKTGCRLLKLADIDSLLQPADEVGYRLDLHSGRELRVGDLSELGIPISDHGWTRRRRLPRRRRKNEGPSRAA